MGNERISPFEIYVISDVVDPAYYVGCAWGSRSALSASRLREHLSGRGCAPRLYERIQMGHEVVQDVIEVGSGRYGDALGAEERLLWQMMDKDPRPLLNIDLHPTRAISARPAASQEEIARRLLDGIEIDRGGCWISQRGCNSVGYPYISIDGRHRGVHAVAHEVWIGPVPRGYVVDHICHNRDASCVGGPACRHRRCVNPAHLRAVTQRENLRSGKSFSGLNARKTTCPQGHPYDYTYPSGRRGCRTCMAAHDRRRRALAK